MALYTILFGLSIFLIILLLAIIKKMFFHWKEEQKIENNMAFVGVDRPTTGLLISTEKCLMRRRQYVNNVEVYELVDKSEISLTKNYEDNNEDNPPVNSKVSKQVKFY